MMVVALAVSALVPPHANWAGRAAVLFVSTIASPQEEVQLEGWAGGFQVGELTSQRTLPPPITHPTLPPGTVKLVAESAPCLDGIKAPAGTSGACVTVFVCS